MTRAEIVETLRRLYRERDQVGRDAAEACRRGGQAPALDARARWLDASIEAFRFELEECDRAPAPPAAVPEPEAAAPKRKRIGG